MPDVDDSVTPASAADPRPARVGVQIAPQHAAYDDIRRTCAAVEELGADIVFNWDHFFPLSGDPDGAHFECWTMLAAWAEATERIEIGALVSCNSARNPNLLADMARTVDHISNGRLILGIGAGWFERDYDEYGYEFGTPGSRLADLDRDLPVIRERLGKLNPPPVRDVPILIGGGGEQKTLRMVAQHATIWHGFGDDTVIAHKHRVLDEWCRRQGRDPLEIERSAGAGFMAGRSPDQDADYAANADALHAVGTRLFTVNLQSATADLGNVRDLIAWRDEKNRASSPGS